ncbi:MAG: YeeE/YedE family protein [Candidatus Tectomicrobia bacterium]|nr:YeeE/YedE family protein [Candidatus Tectomicrobia bacterium]
MTWPLYDASAFSGLFLGLLFGLALEGAGFGSARKLTAQFTLRDFSVFKVMFTAVIVAAIGLGLSAAFGLMPPRSVYIPTLFWGAIALGGTLIGAGFAIGGYCPGTSAVALGSGRLDALVFFIGMVAGIGLFAGFFDVIEPLYAAGQGPEGQRLDQLLGIPDWGIIVGLIGAAIAGSLLGSRLERQRGGPVTAEDVIG